ncbi:MAG: hypothetical protein PHC78_13660 [Verrucomicrobiota bacterium]|nr:hypothetical protein [Verrucomicrobiota bacterium]
MPYRTRIDTDSDLPKLIASHVLKAEPQAGEPRCMIGLLFR